MKQSEKKIEKTLVKVCKEHSGLCIKLLPFSFTGLPDRMCLFRSGLIYFVETKSTGDKPSARQNYVHRQLKDLGFDVFKVDTVEKVHEFMEYVKLMQYQ